MARVAANQDRAQEARREFVYDQHILMRFHRPGGKLTREEVHDYRATPNEKGVHRELTQFSGKYEKGGQYVTYGKPGFEYKDMDIDGDLMSDFAHDLTGDRRSRDGIAADLFPLTARQQAGYTFRLLGRETYRGRDVYRVAFEPGKGEHRGAWQGEALIDAAEYQPVSIHSRMAARIPLVVKTLLGTDIKGLGFSLEYRKFDEGVWFPVSYGGEFQVRGLFFYRRTMAITMSNWGFRRTHVASHVTYAAEGH
jgi:hypothetical protein